jgi:membrane protease YdiL (CAAX protease family)
VDERLRPAWKPLEAVLAAVAALGLGGVLSVPIVIVVRSEALGVLLGAISFELALFVVPVFWVTVVHHQPISALGLSSARRSRDLLAGAGSGLALFAFTVIVVAPAVYQVVTWLTGDPVTPPRQPILPADPNGWQIAIGAVAAVVAAPVAEEVFFRGFLFGALRRRFRFLAAAAVSGVVFGLFHVIPLLIPLMVFVGISLAYIYERRGSLLSSIAAHSAFNLVGYTLIVLALT